MHSRGSMHSGAPPGGAAGRPPPPLSRSHPCTLEGRGLPGSQQGCSLLFVSCCDPMGQSREAPPPSRTRMLRAAASTHSPNHSPSNQLHNSHLAVEARSSSLPGNSAPAPRTPATVVATSASGGGAVPRLPALASAPRPRDSEEACAVVAAAACSLGGARSRRSICVAAAAPCRMHCVNRAIRCCSASLSRSLQGRASSHGTSGALDEVQLDAEAGSARGTAIRCLHRA